MQEDGGWDPKNKIVLEISMNYSDQIQMFIIIQGDEKTSQLIIFWIVNIAQLTKICNYPFLGQGVPI